LKRRERLANHCLKEIFGERGEGSGRSRSEEIISKEMNERINRNTTTKEEYSTEPHEEVAGESKPTTPKDDGLHKDVSATLQMNGTPQIK